MRKIAYVTGTRADFGLLSRTLAMLEASEDLSVGIIATGMHLDDTFGNTIDEIRATQLDLIAAVPVQMSPRAGLTVARATGAQVVGIAEELDKWQADCLLVLGDRPEMLAAAMAASCLSIPIAHVHGGERSGSIDESIRHAVSKLAHIHFVATEDAATRLTRMGESPDNIHVTGAPGLDGIVEAASRSRRQLFDTYEIGGDRRMGVAVFHPVSQEQGSLAEQVNSVLEAMAENDLEIVLLHPNSDAGGDEIDQAIERFKAGYEIHDFAHIPRDDYLGFLSYADIMVGNSSSGIIEAASFGLPVVDVGRRQNLRERGANVRWVPAETTEISSAVRQWLTASRPDRINIYGDGKAAARICSLLKQYQFDNSLLAKVNAY